MKNKFVLLFCIILFAQTSIIAKKVELSVDFKKNSLVVQNDDKKMTIEEKLEKYKGSFQIEVKNIRYKPNIPYNIDELIEKNRKSDRVSYVNIGTDVRLKIYPLSQVGKNKNDEKFEMITTFSN